MLKLSQCEGLPSHRGRFSALCGSRLTMPCETHQMRIPRFGSTYWKRASIPNIIHQVIITDWSLTCIMDMFISISVVTFCLYPPTALLTFSQFYQPSMTLVALITYLKIYSTHSPYDDVKMSNCPS